MIFKHIEKAGADLDLLNTSVNNGKYIFILVFMDGCGPCGETLPKWAQIENKMSNEYKGNDDIMVVSVNKDLLSLCPFVGNISGFPTMKYIHNTPNKKIMESYEDSSVIDKDRSTDSFINWIENSIKRFESVKPYTPTEPRTRTSSTLTNNFLNARGSTKRKRKPRKTRNSTRNQRKIEKQKTRNPEKKRNPTRNQRKSEKKRKHRKNR